MFARDIYTSGSKHQDVMVDSVLLPKKLFRKHVGFGMDFGSSAIKIAYSVPEGDDNVRIHFTSVKNDNIDEVLTFLKEKFAGKFKPGCEVHAIGVGSSNLRDKISEALDIKLQIDYEGDTGLDGFQFMTKHISWDDMFYPPSQSAVEYGSELAKQMSDMYKAISGGKMRPWSFMADVDGNDAAVRAFSMSEPLEFPLLMVGIGSGYFLGLVQEDGSIKGCSNFNAPAGRTFLGLGSLLTGAKDFGELADLASKGDASRVDQWMTSTGSPEPGAMYKAVDLKLFAFGHTSGKDIADFRREDLAAGVLSLIVQSAANEAYFWAAHHKVKQVIFVAGFSSSTAHIREELVKEFNMRRFANSLQHICDCRIMKLGAYLGAMGILVKNLEPATS